MAEREYEITETTPKGGDGRSWDVKVTPPGCMFHVQATGRKLTSTPSGFRPIGRPWSEAEIEKAIEVLVKRKVDTSRGSLGEKVAGGEYRAELTDEDLYRADNSDAAGRDT